MPFKSQKQRALFHAMEERGEISPEKVSEWEHETKDKADLPTYAHGKSSSPEIAEKFGKLRRRLKK